MIHIKIDPLQVWSKCYTLKLLWFLIRLNSDLDNITSANTLLYTFKYLPPSFLDNPNSHFKVSGWTAVPYLSLSNTATGAGWGVILGIYDNNNGTPMGRQFVIGTSKCMERRYLNGTWQSWVDKWSLIRLSDLICYNESSNFSFCKIAIGN